MAESSFWLHALSAVIVIEPANPWTDDLKSQLETIKGSQVVRTIENGTTSTVYYSDGTQITAEPDRLFITKDYDVDFRKCADTEVYDLASRCVDKHQRAKYLGLGLNCAVSTMREKPEEWLTRHFLKPNASGYQISMMPRLAIDVDVDAAVLNLSLGGGWAFRDNGAQEPSIVVECNLDREGPFATASELKDSMARRTESKTKIIAALDKILGDE